GPVGDAGAIETVAQQQWTHGHLRGANRRQAASMADRRGAGSAGLAAAVQRSRDRLPYNRRMFDPTLLANHLLIAMPNLRDPSFARGVAFLCQHGEDGAMGILVNRLSEYRLGDVLAQMSMHTELQDVIDAPVLIGGPVQPERGFV